MGKPKLREPPSNSDAFLPHLVNMIVVRLSIEGYQHIHIVTGAKDGRIGESSLERCR